MKPQAHKVVVLTAPSGAGKTTIARALLAAGDLDLRFSVSATTRAPRDGEIDGVHYHFVTLHRFQVMAAESALLEYEEVYPGRYYGSVQAEVDAALAHHHVLFDVDVKGALNIKALYGDRALTVFIAPPSLEVLEARLCARGTETTDTLATRLERARYEMTFAPRCDRVVVNDNLDNAIAETLSHVRSFLSA